MEWNSFHKVKSIQRVLALLIISSITIVCFLTIRDAHLQQLTLLDITVSSSEIDFLEVLILPNGKESEATITGHYRFNAFSRKYALILKMLKESPCELAHRKFFESLTGSKPTITANNNMPDSLHILLSSNGERTDAIVFNGSTEILVNDKVYCIGESFSNSEELDFMNNVLNIIAVWRLI